MKKEDDSKFVSWVKRYLSLLSMKQEDDRIEKFIPALDIYDKDGYYDREKIEALDEDLINFAYDNGIAYLEELEAIRKFTTTNMMSFLGNLLTSLSILSVVFLFILKESSLATNNPGFYIFLISASFIMVLLLLFLDIRANIYLITPRLYYLTYDVPKVYLEPEIMGLSMKVLKCTDTIDVQTKIKTNLKKIDKLPTYFKHVAACAMPIIVLYTIAIAVAYFFY